MGAFSKVPKGRETTDGGCYPPVIAQQHEKSRRDDRDISNLILNRLCTLSPFQGLVLLMHLFRGLTPPSVVCRPFGTFPVVAQLPGGLPFGQAQAESTPVCSLSRLDFVDLWFGAFPRTAILQNKRGCACFDTSSFSYPYRLVSEGFSCSRDGACVRSRLCATSRCRAGQPALSQGQRGSRAWSWSRC